MTNILIVASKINTIVKNKLIYDKTKTYSSVYPSKFKAIEIMLNKMQTIIIISNLFEMIA